MSATCQNACPPQCASVFDRVVVNYLIKSSTRVLWELLPTFTDPNPLEFQLQVAQTANPHGDWEDVGLPVVNQYFAFDPDQRVWGKTNWTHYRVKLMSPYGVYFSDPVDGIGTLERRAWRVARELVRQRIVGYRVGLGGQEGYLLKRRWTGKACPVCLDYMTKDVRNPACPTCYGTGFECGYFYPMACVWAEMAPRSYHLTLDNEQRGTIKDIAVKAEMLMTALIGEQDVWVSKKTDDRYYVHEIQHISEVRGIPIIAQVSLRPVPYSSVVYTIEIPQQLAALGLTE